jgi:ketosteroid isomerase-like protein
VTRFVLIATAVLVLAGFQPQENAAGCGVSDPGIEQLHRDWNAALARADVDSLLRLLDADFVVVPTAGLPLHRPEELRTALWSILGRERVHASFQCQGRWRQGNLVVESGWVVATVKPHDGTARHTTSARVMQTLRRGPDGRWRFAWRTLQTDR